ncbi:SDR family NAD(P)-dependent oxidoreductase [Microbacterium sp. NPDC058345]|uniref:SDR family NAD(P)-dependent oxidoreductase n=1 Tax=Microbacterium sp. NPDC058345 TaxID=3346455 RepID=UPI0036518084
MGRALMRLDGRRALIVGGGGAGIGRAITRSLSAAGAAVAVADVDRERAAEAVDEVRSNGGTGFAVTGDVRSSAELSGMIESATAQCGGLDTLVTVVGGQVAFVPAVRLHEMRDEDWDTVYELNLRYVARAVRAVLPGFLRQGGGTIVSVGSVTGFMAAPRQAAYGASKAGLLSLARTVSAEYAADGIRMNVVAGGAIATAVNPATESHVPEIPAGRYGRSDEIAEAVVYLASDAAAYISGQQIVVDGGVSTRGPFD